MAEDISDKSEEECEINVKRREEEYLLKGCGLKILMETHSLFFPTFM
jgi:hypothetical protein